MAREAAVPAGSWLLVLWCHCRDLGRVELGQEAPEVIQGSHEQDVCVNIDQRVEVFKNVLQCKFHSLATSMP